MGYILNLATGIVTRDTDGVQVAPTQSTDDPAYIEYINWISQGQHPVEVSIPPPSSSTRITKFAFRSRFTSTEKIIMDIAALDDPTAPMQNRQYAAALRVYLKDLDAAEFVDLSRSDIQEGLEQLVSLGILQSHRVVSILTDPIQPHELFSV